MRCECAKIWGYAPPKRKSWLRLCIIRTKATQTSDPDIMPVRDPVNYACILFMNNAYWTQCW